MADESKYRRELRKELERDFRSKQKKKLEELRGAVKAARAVKRSRLAAVSRACKKIRDKNREHIRQERLQARERINAERDQLRAEARSSCVARRDRVREKTGVAIAAAAAELEAERGRQRSYRVYTRPVKLGSAPKARGARAAEKRRESDDEVEGNIPRELVAVWRKVKSRIKPSEHMSRTEAFEHWVHNHSAEVQEIEAREAEKGIDEWVAQEREHRASMDQDLAELADAELVRQYDQYRQQEGDVPF